MAMDARERDTPVGARKYGRCLCRPWCQTTSRRYYQVPHPAGSPSDSCSGLLALRCITEHRDSERHTARRPSPRADTATSYDNRGEYRLVVCNRNCVVLGEQFAATRDDTSGFGMTQSSRDGTQSNRQRSPRALRWVREGDTAAVVSETASKLTLAVSCPYPSPFPTGGLLADEHL
jgi:hypothetical protein